MRLFRPCFMAGWIYHEAIFRLATDQKLLCLTFDDGPDPDSTPELLAILERSDVKGVFFCNGNAAEKYPGLMKLIISKGHVIGNHGYGHFDGWKTSSESYIADASRADSITSEKLFRPPFGRMKTGQYRKLKEKYRIILWDVMPYDFDNSFSSEKSLKVLKEKIRPGSIIVLHDNPSSSANKIIGEFISFALKSGYRFEIID